MKRSFSGVPTRIWMLLAGALVVATVGIASLVAVSHNRAQDGTQAAKPKTFDHVFTYCQSATPAANRHFHLWQNGMDIEFHWTATPPRADVLDCILTGLGAPAQVQHWESLNWPYRYGQAPPPFQYAEADGVTYAWKVVPGGSAAQSGPMVDMSIEVN